VGVDCGNGTASLFAPELLARAGAQVEPLYCDSDPNFPHHQPDPVKAENMQDLKKLVWIRTWIWGWVLMEMATGWV